ncbi:hypothetical protein E2C01_089929 [Portunus trituberculatus]|uniref:Uncharacterized protein n=1 Tax=Portunus trituberculatus TaxID=210409 RepID=A0A5B7JQX4_PORTR|nr:hypothetical protein [Portunus trituberculatus]
MLLFFCIRFVPSGHLSFASSLLTASKKEGRHVKTGNAESLDSGQCGQCLAHITNSAKHLSQPDVWDSGVSAWVRNGQLEHLGQWDHRKSNVKDD